MEILMVDSREGTRHSHLHVRRVPRFQMEGLEPSLYPKMHSYFDPQVGVNLRFKEAENRKQRRRRTAGLFLGEAGGEGKSQCQPSSDRCLSRSCFAASPAHPTARLRSNR